MTLIEGNADAMAEGQSDKRRRNRELRALVTELHARHMSRKSIGLTLGITAQHVGQMIELLRLEPPRFRSLADCLTWLAKEVPDVELRCRHFRNESPSQAGDEKAA